MGVAFALFVTGLRKGRHGRMINGVLLGVLTVLFFGLLSLWGEMLWFGALGYSPRFWKILGTRISLTAVGALFGALMVYLLTLFVPRERKYTRIGSKALGAVIGGLWGLGSWDIILRYANSVSTEVRDPILGKSTGFYLFSLPFYDALYVLLLLLSILSLITVGLSVFVVFKRDRVEWEPVEESPEVRTRPYGSLYLSAAVLLFVLAWGKYLDRFHLMYSTWGAVAGPGWTDVHVRLPAYAVTMVWTALLGCVLVIPPLRRSIYRLFGGSSTSVRAHFFSLVGTTVLLLGMWFVTLVLIPGLFQWLRVEPNEITLEEPYIAHNIRFTRRGFGLHRMEEREFPASERFTRSMVEDNAMVFSNIRLWDWRALDAVYEQFQEIRLYYKFQDVDIDRYTIGDTYRQVMVSARELDLSNLPRQSQTFVNRRFKYTHGYGITLTTVSEFTPEGLPHLLVKDIPPKSEHPDLKVEHPQIYYGELTGEYVVGNSKEEELDYPRGEENVYIRYPGDGGVVLRNLWRKFLFGWKFDGTRFLLSGYRTPDSRILFHRQIQDRVNTLAPFLRFDRDPYIVLVEGKLYWIIDAYTTSRYYPYSASFSSAERMEYRRIGRRRFLFGRTTGHLDEVNYIRNAVKIVVDALHGSVDFYIFDPEDPIIQVWSRAFPKFFKPKEEMPEGLLAHVRYPADMLLVQGLVYARYHMRDPTVFYNQEDLWVRATEKYYGRVQPVQPYYIMWQLPDSSKPEFVLILPFTPKNRQVLIGWIAGMCDPGNYGRFLAYKFPKEKRILGTQQVETKIDQDPFLSGQLTLWDQRGSNVIRGNVLVIPIEETLLYVEPIYLQAETAAYPELRLVMLMHNDRLSYAETFQKALEGLLEGAERAPLLVEGTVAEQVSIKALVRKASDAFQKYLSGLGEQRFKEASEALETLQDALQQLADQVAIEEGTDE
jgi:uncharacterized membrane protein (UPF0182 family)